MYIPFPLSELTLPPTYIPSTDISPVAVTLPLTYIPLPLRPLTLPLTVIAVLTLDDIVPLISTALSSADT